ncbi:MAG: hypothetical protein AAGA76_06825 [Pseudomonadota bacterium]
MGLAKVKWPLAGLLFLILASCQNGTPSENLSINTKQVPVQAMVSIARAAQKCWFKSKDPAFRDFRLSDEVNSPAGRPRFLLVKRIDPNGLPQLVVQAEQKGDTTTGKFTNIQTFGPLLQTGNGKRITDDVRRWSKGNAECKV